MYITVDLVKARCHDMTAVLPLLLLLLTIVIILNPLTAIVLFENDL